MAFSVQPVILTCDSGTSLTREFVDGFRNVRHALKPAVVLIDQSRTTDLSPAYLRMIASLEPCVVRIHPPEASVSAYDSVQAAANIALALALEKSSETDYILFMEDDIAFSSRFAEKVVNTYLGPETGFLTLYLPGDGYGSDVVAPTSFYGTQCVMFTRKAVSEIVHDRAHMMANFLPGFDIRWSRFLASRGYVLYATDWSYVQHLPGVSRLHGHRSHSSRRFLP